MVIKVKVFPRARINQISREGNFFIVKVTAAPEKGKANKALVKALAEYFDVGRSKIVIQSGEKSRMKDVKILSC